MARLLAPEARTEGLSAYAAPPQASWAWAAAGIAVVVAILLLGPVGMVALMIAVTLAGLAVVALARRQIGGITGDVLGSVEQAGEMAGLVVLAALAGHGWSLGGVV